MIICNPTANQAFMSTKFAYAYVCKSDLCSTIQLWIILKNKVELLWSSSPGVGQYAEKDMIEALELLLGQMSDISTLRSPDRKQAMNVSQFCNARIENGKEHYAKP